MSRLLGQSYRMLALELNDTQRGHRTPGVVVTSLENSHPPSIDETAAGPLSPKTTETRTQTETAQKDLLTLPETNVVSAISLTNRFPNKSIAMPIRWAGCCRNRWIPQSLSAEGQS